MKKIIVIVGLATVAFILIFTPEKTLEGPALSHAESVKTMLQNAENGDVVTFEIHGVRTKGIYTKNHNEEYIVVNNYKISPEHNLRWALRSGIVSVSKPEPQGLH